jgi:glycyl-tRNA synthetase beta chain
MIVENGVRIHLKPLVALPAVDRLRWAQAREATPNWNAASKLVAAGLADSTLTSQVYEQTLGTTGQAALAGRAKEWLENLSSDLLSFFHDRLKVYLRDQGARHDLIDAVITPQSDDLLTIVRRVEALGTFLDTDAGKNLLAGTKRAANILAAEEKKGTAIAAAVDPAKFSESQESALFAALNQAEKEAGEAIQNEDFSAAMRALSALREPVDSFFEGVHVNAEDASVRANRLALLARIRAATGEVADFSKIAG